MIHLRRMDQKQKQAYLILHFCVFIWGFTAILGNLITLKETVLVWYRMGITSLCLLVIPALWKNLAAIPRKQVIRIAGIGILVALHWITFYGAIKYSVVSVALTCLATITFFTSVLEPALNGKKMRPLDVISGLAIIPAIYLIFYFSGRYGTGIFLGLCSAFFAALFSVLNKKMVSRYEAVSITFIELSSGFLCITLFLPVYFWLFDHVTLLPSQNDLVYLLILSIFCTCVPFILSLNCLKYLSAFTSNLTINLEPVYGIIMACFIFHDYRELNTGFYCGAVLILLIVFLNPLFNRYFDKRRHPGQAESEK